MGADGSASKVPGCSVCEPEEGARGLGACATERGRGEILKDVKDIKDCKDQKDKKAPLSALLPCLCCPCRPCSPLCSSLGASLRFSVFSKVESGASHKAVMLLFQDGIRIIRVGEVDIPTVLSGLKVVF